MNDTAFKDHFAPVAACYADYRPTYPVALFDWLAAQCPQHAQAWDCGTGNGQAAHSLAKDFLQVLATDASAAQLAQAPAHPRIHYRAAPAHESGLPDKSVDLITVAQALHWFDLDRFYTEVLRVLKPDGVIAVWSYGIISIAHPAVDACIQDFYQNEINAYWPPERSHVEQGYRTLPFPFTRIRTPDFAMMEQWNLPQLTGYLRSWSATARFIQTNGFDPVLVLEEKLKSYWGSPEQTYRISWPLALLVGHR